MNDQKSKIEGYEGKSDHPFINVVGTEPEAEATNNESDHPPMRNADHPSSMEIDKLDHHILLLISEKCHERAIIRLTKRPRSTIKSRLDRLKRNGFIKPYYFNTALQRVKLYDLTQKSMMFLIHNEERNAPTSSGAHTMTAQGVFAAHAMSFICDIIEGEQPKNHHGYKPKNWTGYLFEDINHKIRTTRKSIIIDVNLDLGADTIDNLNLKYHTFAQKFAVEFAERHNIVIGQLRKNRNPHYEVGKIPFIKFIADRGEFQTPDIKIDKSRSDGDLEFNERSARAFDFTINQMPGMIAEMKAEMNDKLDRIEKIIKKEKEG